jgi:surfactin synthase thioesterase subunit
MQQQFRTIGFELAGQDAKTFARWKKFTSEIDMSK